MSEPVWIDCASVADVGPPEQLADRATRGHHVVLRFPSLRPGEKDALIRRLSAALPEHSVFYSGGRRSYEHVTIMPFVSRTRVLEQHAEVLRSMAEYRRMCRDLIDKYQAGSLSAEWSADEHGGHVNFTNVRTGQEVEAPVWADPDVLDPYFYAKFVKTTTGLETVAALIENDFHDGARILDIVAAEAAHHRSG
jgi:hypothetical protein